MNWRNTNHVRSRSVSIAYSCWNDWAVNSGVPWPTFCVTVYVNCVPRSGTVNYRILYFFAGSDIVCLSHGITKEKEIPGNEIDVAIQRKKLVIQDSDQYSTEWEK